MATGDRATSTHQDKPCMDAQRNDKRKSILWNGLKWVVSFGLLAWLLLWFDWKSLLATLQSVSLLTIGIGFLLLTFSQVVNSLRLWLLFKAQGMTFTIWYSLQLVFSGLYASNFLPTTVGGDAVKIAFLFRSDFDKSHAASTIVADRLINLSAITLLTPSVITIAQVFAQNRLRIPYLVAGLVVAFSIGIMLFIVIHKRRASILEKLTSSDHTSNIAKRFLDLLISIVANLAEWISQPLILGAALILSWLAIALAILTVFVLARGLGIQITYFQMMGIAILVYFANLIPLSLNGLGIQEASRTFLLISIGAAAPLSLALSILARAVSIGVSLLGIVSMPKL
jgi:uncharacterized protein (TIRG00374 family)